MNQEPMIPEHVKEAIRRAEMEMDQLRWQAGGGMVGAINRIGAEVLRWIGMGACFRLGWILMGGG